MIYNNYYDLLERFAIMTANGRVSDENAFLFLQDKTTPELLTQLKSEMGTSRPAPDNKDDLLNYVINNISLYPCNQNARPLCKIYDEQKNIIDENRIKDAETLENWKQKGVSLFAFYPEHNNFIVLDLDNSDEHANKSNGIKNFLDLIAGIELNEQVQKYFKDFPNNFPCYVKTPHNGIHLYFKSSYIPDNWTPNKNELNALNIEIKYNNQVTAGGSLRNGKKYTFHGDLKNAPRMNTAIIDLLTKGRPAPIKRAAKPYQVKDGENWNTTPEGIINKAQELYTNDTPHYFVMKTAVLFKNAGFSKELATEYIKQTPQHLGRKDQNDTTTAINSIF